MQNEYYAQKMAVPDEKPELAVNNDALQTTPGASPQDKSSLLTLDPVSEAEVDRLMRSESMCRELAVEQVLRQTFQQKGRTILVCSLVVGCRFFHQHLLRYYWRFLFHSYPVERV
jgi:hypothetical protein